MADLLEALLQIKALAGTPFRVERLLDPADPGGWTARPAPGERTPAEIVAHLAEAEDVFHRSARLILTRERPPLPALPRRADGDSTGAPERDRAAALARFAARRRETVGLLSACSAAQLERVGVHPVRKLVSLADLVAIMLAHDTDHVGQIVERLRSRRSPEDSPAQA